jgi:hypothetical protein
MSARNTQKALYLSSGGFLIAFIIATAIDAHHYAGWLLMGFFLLIAVAHSAI